MTLDSLQALSSYAITHPVNNPTDLKISVKVSQTASGSNMYSGQVFVSYYDNGQYYTGKFYANNTNNIASLYKGVNQASYNKWFTQSSTGKQVFHGFFQDQYGAVMLIIDDSLDQGDGSGATEVSGSLWFKNFANSQAFPNSNNVPCWFITTGPYDCRTFLTSGNNGDGNVDTFSALYPSDSVWYQSIKYNAYAVEEPARGWKKLGTFSGLKKALAFGQ